MARILIIDDDAGITRMMERIARKLGHEAFSARSLSGGMDSLRSNNFDCVFLDVRLPDGNGLGAIPDIKETASSPEVIIITGHGDPDGAELAITSGAWSYIEKTASLDQLTLALEQAVKYRQRRDMARTLILKREGVVGESQGMTRVLDDVAQAAQSRANVLLLGETGTGKELIARAIHANSPRAQGNFVAVDCAALPKTLVESMLFGHAKGAFTGAETANEGLVKLADNGTLFLDEVGELPLDMQKAFLRVLQERKFRPLGGKTEVVSDFRLVAATNRDLEKMCEEGSFRPDLLFRLKTLVIEIPPLRERMEDIKPLVLHHLAKLCDSYGLPVKGISPDVLAVFRQYNWPGNVRELVNILERMLIVSFEEPMLNVEHFPVDMRARAARLSVQEKPEEPDAAEVSGLPTSDHGWSKEFPCFREYRKTLVSSADKAYLHRLMELSGGSIKRACDIAGLSRTRLYYLMKEHGISKRLS